MRLCQRLNSCRMLELIGTAAGSREHDAARFTHMTGLEPLDLRRPGDVGVHQVMYREAHVLLEELAEASVVGDRKERFIELASVPLLVIDDLGMRKLPATAAEDLLELVMRRYERASTLITSNRPVEDWGKLLGDTAAVTAMLDRLLHHAHVLKSGPRSYRTRHVGLQRESAEE